VFRVTVNSISEPVTPELTDEWVDSTFGTSDDVHTVEELKAFFSSALYDQNLEDAIMDALLDTADFKDVPKQISDYYACMFLNYYYQLANYYSSDLDTIAQAQGYTDANAMLGASDTVITHLAKQDLLYQAIAETQGIQPTQEQLDAAAASYSGSSYGDNFIHQTALQTAVMEWLKAHVVIS
jgi:trigger factor